MRFKVRNLVLAAIGIGILALLFASGVLDWQRARARFSQGARNVASDITTAPSGLSAPAPMGNTSSAAKCRENLRRIETAKRTLARKTGFDVGDVNADALKKELGSMPKCPSGGRYSVGDQQSMPKCSIAANGTHESADDHILVNF